MRGDHCILRPHGPAVRKKEKQKETEAQRGLGSSHSPLFGMADTRVSHRIKRTLWNATGLEPFFSSTR